MVVFTFFVFDQQVLSKKINLAFWYSLINLPEIYSQRHDASDFSCLTLTRLGFLRVVFFLGRGQVDPALKNSDVISFFVTRKSQKIRKIDEISWYWRGKSSYILNDLRNFNGILKRMWLIIILKFTKIQGFTLSLEHTFLEKLQGGSNWPPSLLRVNVLGLFAFNVSFLHNMFGVILYGSWPYPVE